MDPLAVTEALTRARLHTGEVNLAAAFVRAWHEGSEFPSVVDDRMARFAIQYLDTYEKVLLSAYPQTIRLACMLIDPCTITPILNVTTSALTQADHLLLVVANAMGDAPNDALRVFTVSVVGCAHRAMLYMYGLRSSKHVKYQRWPLNRALMTAAHRQRA